MPKCPICQVEWKPSSSKRPGWTFCPNQKPKPHKFWYSESGELLTEEPTTASSSTVTVLSGGMGSKFGFSSRPGATTSSGGSSPPTRATKPNPFEAMMAEQKEKEAADKDRKFADRATQKPKDVEEGHRRKLEELRGIAPGKGFDMLDQPQGEGTWEIAGYKVYDPGKPIQVPGTGFKDIRPSQAHVNRKIVEGKLAKGLAGVPVVPACIMQDGGIALLDKHHTFVACMAIGRPVKLALIYKQGVANPMSDWMSCTWKGFQPPKEGVAVSGFNAQPFEQEAPADPQWKTKVPWRAGEPSQDDRDGRRKYHTEKVAAGLKAVFRELGSQAAVDEELRKACEEDPALAESLYETLNIGAISVKVRRAKKKTESDEAKEDEAEEGSTGGDWDPESNTVFLDDDLTPVNMVDMLVWEAFNAKLDGDFAKQKHDAYDARDDPGKVGKLRGSIEAKTQLLYLEHLIARERKGTKPAPNGQGHLDAINNLCHKNMGKAYSDMEPDERKRNEEAIVSFFLATPHGGPKVHVTHRNSLATGELYAYQHVADTQNCKGITAYFKAKLDKMEKIDEIDPGRVRRQAFLTALGKVKDCTLPDPPNSMSYAGLFYVLAARRAEQLFGLKDPAFSEHQVLVATTEYEKLNGQWRGQLEQDLSVLK